MKVKKEQAEWLEWHFERKDQTGAGAMSFIISALLTVVWYATERSIPASVFTKFMWETAKKGEEASPTGIGFLMGIWYGAMMICFVSGLTMILFNLIILRTYKRQYKLGWLRSIVHLYQALEGTYDVLSFGWILFAQSILLPLVFLFPIPLTNGWKVFGLYLLTVLSFSIFTIKQNDGIERLGSFFAKYDIKEQEKKEKEEAKKLEKEYKKAKVQPEIQKPKELSIQEKLNIVLQYFKNSPYVEHFVFHSEVENILEEIERIIHEEDEIDFELAHEIDRMLTEEIPSVCIVYDQLEDESKQELKPHFVLNLNKMIEKLKQTNEQRKNKKEFQAKKLLNVLEERY